MPPQYLRYDVPGVLLSVLCPSYARTYVISPLRASGFKRLRRICVCVHIVGAMVSGVSPAHTQDTLCYIFD